MENHVVHKSNDLVEAKFKLPLIEQRILAICVSKINPTKSKMENPYRFNLQEYCELAGCSLENMHKELKGALKNLQTRVLEKYDPDIGRTRFFSWTRKIDVWDSQSYDVYFHEEIEADLLAKTKYTEYLLKSAFNLGSKYSLRLYELAKQKRGLSKAPMMSVEKLRTWLGIDEDTYSEYRDFKKRCLKPALEDINENTDLNIDVNEFRKDRKVDLLELIITDSKPKPVKLKSLKKQEATKPSDDPTLFDLLGPQDELNNVIEALMPLGIRPAEAIKLAQEFGAEKVIEVHGAMGSQPIKEGANLAGVLINKLRDAKVIKESIQKKVIVEKKKSVSIEANRTWWNDNYRELLADPFWHQDRPLFVKNSPFRVENDNFCMVGLEVVQFNRPDFQEFILGKVKQFEDKLNERIRK